MNLHEAAVDADGDPLLDANGRYQRGELTGIFVMRKEPGFGEAYQQNRTGEWEYVAFRPDRTYLSAPPMTASCAICHRDAGATKDWTFRTDLNTRKGSSALPNGAMLASMFIPDVIRVKAGNCVTWYNQDESTHTVTAADGGFDSGRMVWGNSFSVRFPDAGAFEFVCSLHPTMKGVAVVE